MSRNIIEAVHCNLCGESLLATPDVMLEACECVDPEARIHVGYCVDSVIVGSGPKSSFVRYAVNNTKPAPSGDIVDELRELTYFDCIGSHDERLDVIIRAIDEIVVLRNAGDKLSINAGEVVQSVQRWREARGR